MTNQFKLFVCAAALALFAQSCAKEAAPEASAEAPAAAPAAVQAAKSAVDAAKAAVADAAQAVEEAAAPVVEKAKEAVEAAPAAAEAAVEEVKAAAAETVETVKEEAAKVVEKAKDVAADAVEKAKDAVAEAPAAVAAAAAPVVAAVAEAVAPAAEEAKPAEAPAPAGAIRMITEATFPPYEFRQGTEIVGIDVEICKAIAKELGKELKIEDVEFDSVLPSLIAGKAELAAAGITVTEDRKMQVDFSVPYVRTGIVFIFSKDKPFDEAKPEEAKGKRVGVQNGTTSADYVREKLGQEPEMFDSPASAFAALKAGKVDVVIADIDPAKAVVKGQDGYDISDLLTVEEYAVAIKKGQPELLATMNKVIEGLQDSGKLDEIKDEWTAKAEAAAAAEEAKPAEAPAAE